MYGLSLIPFQTDAGFNLSVSLSLVNPKQLFIRYHLEGDLSQIKWPSHTDNPERQSELWQATCFECFISATNKPDYYETNLSPNHAWHSYHFSSYRQGMQSANDLILDSIHSSQSDSSFQLSCLLSLSDATGSAIVTETSKIGLSAVILDKTDHYHYYALNHPNKKLDFHDNKGHSISGKSLRLAPLTPHKSITKAAT